MNDPLKSPERGPLSDEDLLALLAEAYPSPKTDIPAAVRARMNAKTLAPIPSAKKTRRADPEMRIFAGQAMKACQTGRCPL